MKSTRMPAKGKKEKERSSKPNSSSKKELAMMGILLEQLKHWSVEAEQGEQGEQTPARKKRGRKPKLKERSME